MVRFFRACRHLGTLFALFLFCGVAFAQRGANYTAETTPDSLPGQGFPGMFDSRMADAGKFSLDIPSLAADYGVNERLTIGTNGWAVGALAFGFPVLYGKIRYRFLSTESVSSVHTVYLGAATNRLSKNNAKSDGYFFGLSNNTSFLLGDRGELTATFFYVQLSQKQQESDTKMYSNAAVSTLLAGLTYQHWVTNWFGPSAMVLLAPYVGVDADSSGAAISARVSGGQVLILRAYAEFAAGQSWLLSPGFYQISSLSEGAAESIPFPVFSAAVKW